MSEIRGWASLGAKQKLVPYSVDPGQLGPEDVEVAVEYCGVCHSDLSVMNNDWGNSVYPFVPGHEVVGRVVGLGERTKGLTLGQKVGVGWTAATCLSCHDCMSGDQHLCTQAQATIVGHNGGFADKVRAHWSWTIPLPEGLDLSSAGPLLCGGVTVFSPLMHLGIKPTQRVGVVGIGGLGHMALKFANAWGCDVTAFTSSESKADEAKSLGAHHVVSSRDSAALAKISRTLDLLLVTVNVPLDWSAMLGTVKSRGKMHVVGAVLEPIPVAAMDLIFGERSVSGSPTGSPTTMATMLDFAARHKIAPQVEHFPLERVNDAMEHLKSGKARYRIVLDVGA